MNDERWDSLVDKIENQFGIESYKKLDLYRETDEGERLNHGYTEILIFNGMQGKMKLERISKPLVLDKKVHYSGRKSESRVEYVYSEKDYMNKVIAYLWKNNEWKEIDFKL